MEIKTAAMYASKQWLGLFCFVLIGDDTDESPFPIYASNECPPAGEADRRDWAKERQEAEEGESCHR